jgi:protein-tyrosine phosphatase
MKTILAITTVVLFTACGDTVGVHMLNAAADYCKDKDGVSKIETIHIPIFDAIEPETDYRFTCMNGESTSFAAYMNRRVISGLK